MFPDFLVHEITVRESGEGAVFDTGAATDKELILTLGITHAIEQQRIDVEIHGSADGVNWSTKPLLSFPPKFYCGTYHLVLRNPARYLKAVWKVSRLSRGETRPYFTFYILGQHELVRALAGVA
jgi:hypothetical protein